MAIWILGIGACKGLKMRCDGGTIARNSDGWEHYAWTVRIGGTVTRKDGKRMRRVATIAYRMGLGHKGAEPELIDIVACLLRDAECGSLSFREFASEYGGENAADTHAAWLGCRKARKQLAWLFPGGVSERLRDAAWER